MRGQIPIGITLLNGHHMALSTHPLTSNCNKTSIGLMEMLQEKSANRIDCYRRNTRRIWNLSYTTCHLFWSDCPSFKDTISAHAYSESFLLAASINHLYKTYAVVDLKMSPFFHDIRPFLCAIMVRFSKIQIGFALYEFCRLTRRWNNYSTS